MKLISARTGGGKGNLIILWVLLLVARGEKYITVALPHPPDWRKLIAELYFAFGATIFPRLVIDRVTDKDLVVMRQFIPRPSGDPFDFEDQIETNCDLVIDQLANRRGVENFLDRPVLEGNSILLSTAAQTCTKWISDSEIYKGLFPQSRVWADLIAHGTKGDIIAQLQSLEHYGRRERTTELEPVARMFKAMYGRAAIRRRASKPPVLRKRQHLNEGGITIICGDGVNKMAFRTLVLADLIETVRMAHEGLERGGVYIVDELVNYSLDVGFFLTALATCRYTGLELIAAVQLLNPHKPEVTSDLLANCDLYFGPTTDPKMADIAAAALRGGYDRMKVHHEEKTIHFDPSSEHESQRRVTNAWHNLGQLKDATHVLSEADSTVNVTRYTQRIETRKIYESGRDQAFWQAAEIQELPVGTFWVKEQGKRPYKMETPLVQDSWRYPGFATEKVEECIANLKAARSDIYQEPAIRPVPRPRSNGKPVTNGTNGHTGGKRRGMS